MIGYFKKNIKNCKSESAFDEKKKKPALKFNPRVSTNRGQRHLKVELHNE